MLRTIISCALIMAVLKLAAQTADITAGEPSNTVISRHIYGQFAEHLGRCIYDGFTRDGKIRMDVVNALKAIRIPNLRWPGGCFADQYHWRDGIGPLAGRPKTVNTTWGMVTEDNSFGTHEFLQLCELIGCDPYIAGNVGTGTPAEMKDWVEYLNFGGTSTLSGLRAANGHPAPYNVPFWGVGNESWGCGGMMTPETYATLYRTYALFAKSYPGAPLKKIAGGANGEDYHWTEVLMQNIPLRQLWGLSFHYYTRADDTDTTHYAATGFGEDQYFHFMQKALRMDTLIEKHGAIMDQYDPEKKVAMVVDEWGIWVDAEPGTNPEFLYQQNSLRDALIAASTLNSFNNHANRVKMANLAQTVNVIQALILTKGDSLLLTPTYHVFDLMKVHQDARLIPLTIESPDYTYQGQSIKAVNASASLDSLGRTHVTLVNVDPSKEITVTMKLANAVQTWLKEPQSIAALQLTAPNINSYNDFGKTPQVKPVPFQGATIKDGILTVKMPAKSVVALEMKD